MNSNVGQFVTSGAEVQSHRRSSQEQGEWEGPRPGLSQREGAPLWGLYLMSCALLSAPSCFGSEEQPGALHTVRSVGVSDECCSVCSPFDRAPLPSKEHCAWQQRRLWCGEGERPTQMRNELGPGNSRITLSG